MVDSSKPSEAMPPVACKANRALGAMFFACFGTARHCWRDVLIFGGAHWSLAVVSALGLGLPVSSARRFVANRSALADAACSPDACLAKCVFRSMSVVQRAVTVVVANVLERVGLDAWRAPMTMAVVGLHVLPLAAVMRYVPHDVSGLALVLLAVLFAFAAEVGPRSGAGPLGAGLILWASAIVSLTVGSTSTAQNSAEPAHKPVERSQNANTNASGDRR